jgi:hypothetical protein
MIPYITPQQMAKDILTCSPIILDQSLGRVKSLFEINILLKMMNATLGLLEQRLKLTVHSISFTITPFLN